MILSAAALLREYGASATSIDRVLAHSGAPRGSVYHHFPGGRAQLIDEAVALAGDFIAGAESRPPTGGPSAGASTRLRAWRRTLTRGERVQGRLPDRGGGRRDQ
nr:helix-turn-helix domain-containing protein [Streptomyces sp. DHE17-7]